MANKKPNPAGAAPAKAGDGMLNLVRSRLRLHRLEDRLLLDGADAGGQQVAFWLTRSMALQLFAQLRKRMEADSPAGKTPSQWRDEALALEHAAIMKSEQAVKQPAQWKVEIPAQLVEKIGMQQVEGRSRLGFFVDGKPAAAMALGKTPLHRFTAMLALRIQQARWDAGLDLAWLARPVLAKPAGKKAN